MGELSHSALLEPPYTVTSSAELELCGLLGHYAVKQLLQLQLRLLYLLFFCHGNFD